MKEKLRMLFDEKLWKFLLVGVLNTLVGNGLMFLLYNLAGFSYWPATGLSYALASVMSYFLNRYFTFKYQGSGFRPTLPKMPSTLEATMSSKAGSFTVSTDSSKA